MSFSLSLGSLVFLYSFQQAWISAELSKAFSPRLKPAGAIQEAPCDVGVMGSPDLDTLPLGYRRLNVIS